MCFKQDIEKAKEKMPEGTETFMIEGGNHRGFGSYTHNQGMDWEVSTSLVDLSFRPSSQVDCHCVFHNFPVLLLLPRQQLLQTNSDGSS